MLGRSFYSDPFYTLLFPDDKRRQRSLPWWMAFMVRYGLRYGTVYAASNGQGVAVWTGPERPHPRLRHLLLSGLPAALWRMGTAGCRRLLDINQQWEKFHHQEATPHWYLMLLGVEPSEQGRGIGGALLEPVLQMANSGGYPCWLETTTEQNVRFYQQRGFQVVARGDLGIGSHYWCMRRHP